MTLSILMTILILSCGHKKQLKFNQEQDRFIAIYIESLRLKEKYPTQESLYSDSLQSFLKKVQFTENDFNHIISVYQKNPEQWELFYKEVLNRLKDFNKSSEVVPR